MNAAVDVFKGTLAWTVCAMCIVIKINAQPIRDGRIIDAEYDDGIRSDFTRLARQTFVGFFCVPP